MEKPIQNFRIDKLSIRDYKGIDSLDLEFPRPKFPDDPDIFVIGSRNGLGKTSVLECCAWGLVSVYAHSTSGITGYISNPTILSKVKCSAKERVSSVDITLSLSRDPQKNFTDRIVLNDEIVEIDCSSKNKEQSDEAKKFWDLVPETDQKYTLGGTHFPTPFVRNSENQNLNPSFDHFFVYFPDNRTTSIGTVSLKDIQSKNDRISLFKIQIIQAIMGKSGILEGQSQEKSESRFEFLNELAETFAGAEVSHQLKTDEDSSLDIRVRPKTNGEGNTYSIDGLSSGQKEIISTLFLIWENTRNAPKVVLIDEPELHLNAEWHRLFIHKLCEIAPWNQYIIATHSEHVMDAVDGDRRILLVKEDGK